MFRLEILPARYGDCILLEYGSDPVRRMLIDGGAPGVYKRALKPRLKELADDERDFELLVITHVDYDHIRGIIELAHDDSLPFKAKDIWFNGFRHLPKPPGPKILAGKHGEELTDLILKNGHSWNCHGFNGNAVVIPENGDLPRIKFDDMTVTLMAPTLPMLADLRKDWEKSCEDIDITPEELEKARSEGRFALLGDEEQKAPEKARPDIEQLLREEYTEDNSSANGSSIAFLVEYDDYRVLLAGDAHPSTLVESIKRLGEERLKLDFCKLPHHGSRGSVSSELIQHLDCENYIFSSNGDQFRHPHPEAVARVIEYGGGCPNLLFNYRTRWTEIWDDKPLRDAYGYETRYPKKEQDGLTIVNGECQ
ncbi:MAG: MBL fold metallo-hydrolase [Candidatus Thiodiazotropha sp.]|nr:MBL fold metallo-hydrolase [Candidatus Thiodiazotropha sp. (ex Codakia orbicularis)]